MLANRQQKTFLTMRTELLDWGAECSKDAKESSWAVGGGVDDDRRKRFNNGSVAVPALQLANTQCAERAE